MSDTPHRAVGRAPFFTIAALAAVVVAGLGAGRLTMDRVAAHSARAAAPSAPAHAAEAPPQSLAFTADFFEAMGLDERSAPEPAPELEPQLSVCGGLGMSAGLAARPAPAAAPRPAERVAAESDADPATLTTASGVRTLAAPPTQSE